MKPTRYPRAELIADREPSGRWIVPPSEGGWTEPRFSEWQLTGESWSDQHPHDEYVYVLEGRLFVEAGGETVEALPGDLVRVPAGSIGRYWAPRHARMLGIYGPNPLNGETRRLGFAKLGEGRE